MNAATNYTAVKAVYDRKAKSYKPQVERNAMLHLIHFGYFVYENGTEAAVLAGIRAGRFCSGWTPPHVAVVVAFLEAEVAAYEARADKFMEMVDAVFA